MASYPTYDPNMFQKGLTVQQAKDLFSESTGVPALSRAIQGTYAPASTFKALSVVAASAAGYNMNSSYKCPSTVQIGNREFKNFEAKTKERLAWRPQSRFLVTRFGIKSHTTTGCVMAV